MARTIRWGIIGCGDVTEVKSGPAFQKATNSALVAVMRRHGDLAKDYAQRHGVPRWYDDAAELIADSEVDVVYIATPPHAHKQHTLSAAAAGKPVYVEKPMAMNFAECQEMIGACRDAGVPLWVAYYRRALPRFLRARQLLASGAIGEPRIVTIALYQKPRLEHYADGRLPWRVQPELSGGGIFVDLAAHTLDFLDYCLGPIESAAGHAGNQAGLYAAEDTVTGSFVFASGVQGAGAWCFAAHENFDRIEIVGAAGKITLSTFGVDPVQVSRGGNVTTYAEETPAHVQQPLIQSIVNELNGEGSCPSTGESAARTTWAMDRLLDGYYGPA